MNRRVMRGVESMIDTLHAAGPGRRVAVFDADGTLWRSDLGEAFFRYQLEQKRVPRAPGPDPWKYYLKEVRTGDAARAFAWLAQWNAGVRETELKSQCVHFVRTYWSSNVFMPMRNLVQTLTNAHFEVWVVSGSMRWVVATAARSFGIPPRRVIGVSVEVKNGRLTERVSGVIPYRDGKARAVQETIRSAPLFAAGNTWWDKELLETSRGLKLAISSENRGGPNYGAEQRLTRFAAKHGWLVQRF